YRDVWLVSANPVHIDQWGVYAYPEVEKNKGTLHVQVALTNESTGVADLSILSELVAPDGMVVARKTTNNTVNGASKSDVRLTLDVENPMLWSLEKRHQGILRTTVMQGRQQMVHNRVHTGFRTLTFDANKGCALNGDW